MDWVQTLSIMGTILGSIYFFHRDIKEDIKIHTARLDQQSLRSDKLYEMFYELLNSIKENRK